MLYSISNIVAFCYRSVCAGKVRLMNRVLTEMFSLYYTNEKQLKKMDYTAPPQQKEVWDMFFRMSIRSSLNRIIYMSNENLTKLSLQKVQKWLLEYLLPCILYTPNIDQCTKTVTKGSMRHIKWPLLIILCKFLIL